MKTVVMETQILFHPTPYIVCSMDFFIRNWSNESMTGYDQLGEKHEALEKSFRKASFQKGPWLEPKMNYYNSCVFHEILSI